MYFQIGRLTGNNAVQTASEGKTCCSRCLYFRDSAESPCGVCGAELYRRLPKSLSISSAFLTAAVVLYFPANILPIMISSNPAATESNTIFSGIAYMWDEGDRLIAAVIFSASILVLGAEDCGNVGFDCGGTVRFAGWAQRNCRTSTASPKRPTAGR